MAQKFIRCTSCDEEFISDPEPVETGTTAHLEWEKKWVKQKKAFVNKHNHDTDPVIKKNSKRSK